MGKAKNIILSICAMLAMALGSEAFAQDGYTRLGGKLMPYIVEKATFDKKYSGVAKFPASTRDISMVVDKSVMVGTLETAIEKRGGKLLESIKEKRAGLFQEKSPIFQKSCRSSV